MKNKTKLKKYGRRALTLLSSLAMMLPLLTVPVQALSSANITAKVRNGQVPIFKWEAMTSPRDLPKGATYVLALTENNQVWRNASGVELPTRSAADVGGFGFNTYDGSNTMDGREFNDIGHPQDVFYTVGDGLNPLVLSYTGDWDSTNCGPKVSVWATRDDKITVNGLQKINTTLYAMTENSDYNLVDTIKEYRNAKAGRDYFNTMLTLHPGDKDYIKWRDEDQARMAKYGIEVVDFVQAVSNQQNGIGENPLKDVHSKVSKFTLCLRDTSSGKENSGISGNFVFTDEVTWNNPSLRVGTTEAGYDSDDAEWNKVWCERESSWSGRGHFNLWKGTATMYSALTQSYEIGAGQTLTLNAEEGFDGVYIPLSVKLVVQPGGTLAINESVYNDGTIINNGGTVIIQSKGSVTNLGTDGKNEILVKNGDLIIMPGGALYTNPDYPMVMANSRLINFGYFIMGGDLMLYSSFLENREGGVIAGNLRFGDRSRDRFYQTDWDSNKKVYVRNWNKWVDMDRNTHEIIQKSGSWTYDIEWGEDDAEYSEMVYESGRRNKYLERDEKLLIEKKNWNAYFSDTKDMQLERLKTNGVPNHMENFSGEAGMNSQIYVFDTQEHFNTYGCITEYEGSYKAHINLSKDNLNGNDVNEIFYDKDTLNSKINGILNGYISGTSGALIDVDTGKTIAREDLPVEETPQTDQ